MSLIGAGAAWFFVSERILLSDLFVQKRGRAFGFMSAASQFGSILAAGLAVVILAMWSWQYAFVPVLVFLVGLVLAFHWISRERYEPQTLAAFSERQGALRDTAVRVFATSEIRLLVIAYTLIIFVWEGVLAFLPIFVIEEPWVIAGSALLGAFGMLMLILTSAYPHTTFEGERAAAPWRGYRAGLQEEAKRRDDGIDLDIAFTYIVSMGLTARFDQQFKRAGKAGYIPKWLGELGTSGSGGRRDWYPYWTSFHHSVHPQAGGSGSSAGGAATGSGGSGGRF